MEIYGLVSAGASTGSSPASTCWVAKRNHREKKFGDTMWKLFEYVISFRTLVISNMLSSLW
jgi:hypothetical protein